MINFLKGKIEDKGTDHIALNVHDVGYMAYASGALLECALGEDVKVYTYHYIRENSMELFGFLDKEDLNFFKVLISVSGIGPKSAMGILGKTDKENIKKAIISNDASSLISFGIGKRTAERLVMELKSKFNKIVLDDKNYTDENSEAVEGLAALGYSKVEAITIFKKLPANIQDTGEKIKWALKNL
ncbi:MAG: Holliday junction branch migration protein RuvA [bacterium]